ncbi:MAG: PIN domain-containing protein [Patescibacteria group bacterium]
MILDTNAYSALARGIPVIIELVSDVAELTLPLPVIAELRYGFAKGSQLERNEQSLQRFLAQPQISIILPTLKTSEHYAAIQLLCQQRGKVLSQNDIWIAALARETDDVLVTFDRDFKVLAEVFSDKLIILE